MVLDIFFVVPLLATITTIFVKHIVNISIYVLHFKINIKRL